MNHRMTGHPKHHTNSSFNCKTTAGLHGVRHGLENFGGPVAGSIDRVSLAAHEFICSMERIADRFFFLGYTSLQVLGAFLSVTLLLTMEANIAVGTAVAGTAVALVSKQFAKKQRQQLPAQTPQCLQDLSQALIQQNLWAVKDLLQEADHYAEHETVIKAKRWVTIIEDCQEELFQTMQLTDRGAKLARLRELRRISPTWECLPDIHGLKVYLACLGCRDQLW